MQDGLLLAAALMALFSGGSWGAPMHPPPGRERERERKEGRVYSGSSPTAHQRILDPPRALFEASE